MATEMSRRERVQAAVRGDQLDRVPWSLWRHFYERESTAEQLAEVTVATPEEAKKEPYSRDVAAGRYDLVIYDRVTPAAPPEANALYFGAMPPGTTVFEGAGLVSPLDIASG